VATHWFCIASGKRQGPFDLDQLVSQLLLDEAPQEVSVWHEGLESWAKAGTLPEVANKLPPPLPVLTAPPASVSKGELVQRPSRTETATTGVNSTATPFQPVSTIPPVVQNRLSSHVQQAPRGPSTQDKAALPTRLGARGAPAQLEAIAVAYRSTLLWLGAQLVCAVLSGVATELGLSSEPWGVLLMTLAGQPSLSFSSTCIGSHQDSANAIPPFG
jgi:hypothetical protein